MLMVYVTTDTFEAASAIGSALVAEKLVACANILPQMHSVYEWNGKVESKQEAVLLLKTTADCFPRLEARIKEMSHYEVPCIVAWRPDAASQPFADWVEKTCR